MRTEDMQSFRIQSVWVGAILAALVTTGCDDAANSGASDMDSLAAQLDQNNKASADAAAAEKAAAEQAQAEAAKQAADEEAAKQAAAIEDTRHGTAAGSITVGQGGGYYSAIVGAHRHITTRVDDLAWTQAVQHYKATEGRMPKDHEEFMTKVIKPMGIPLPELEQGQEYLWDPSEGDWGTLYIVEPNPQP